VTLRVRLWQVAHMLLFCNLYAAVYLKMADAAGRKHLNIPECMHAQLPAHATVLPLESGALLRPPVSVPISEPCHKPVPCLGQGL
jgi:hypothetical protein